MADSSSVTTWDYSQELAGVDNFSRVNPEELAGRDNIIGSPFNDTLRGFGGDDTMFGGEGDDVLNGGAGSDLFVINRGDGHDTITDATSEDTLQLGSGIAQNDLSKRLADGDLTIFVGENQSIKLSNWQNTENPLRNLLLNDGTSVNFDDLPNAGSAEAGRVFSGGKGKDVFTGTSGDDTMLGAKGADVLSGGAGADVLFGGKGKDTLTGGAGADTFVLGPVGKQNMSRITDFNSSEGDRIQLVANKRFSGLANSDGSLREGVFTTVSNRREMLADTNHSLIYNTSSGKLFYRGAGGSVVELAKLTNKPNLSASDIFVAAKPNKP